MAKVLTLDGIYRKPWRPSKKVSTRRKQLAKRGSKCFLKVAQKGGKKYPKYPVCNSKGRVTCQGLWAAWARAGTRREILVRRKALRRAKAKKCSWTRGKR
jgi:hypothetical protein